MDFELNFSFRKSMVFEFDAASLPAKQDDGSWVIRIPFLEYVPEFESVDKLYLARDYGGKYQYFELTLLKAQEIAGVGTDVTVRETSTSFLETVTSLNVTSFALKLYWKEPLLYLSLYAEAESEDERFRLTLENFGRKIDEENEYIFRDSDINEELTDYVLLNKKRKELLLEGDKIYPYMGSYKALINVLNLFGYYDVEIKEYFLNVDQDSLDKGKFLAIPIAKSAEQKKIIKRVWEILPSKIFKKTSLFGLYYKLNKESGEYDDYGIPLVIEDYQFSPEEVLIKLFGLKELLKKEYLPLNARIYDITGEGLYFERYNFETWNDTVDVRVLEIGKRPIVNIFPSDQSYIRDLRRIDQYYVEKFTAQGYQGFLGPTATNPNVKIEDNALAYTFPNGAIKLPVKVATQGNEIYTISSGKVTGIYTPEEKFLGVWKYNGSSATDTAVLPYGGYFKLDQAWNGSPGFLAINNYSYYSNISVKSVLENLKVDDILTIQGYTNSSFSKDLRVISVNYVSQGFEEIEVEEIGSTGASAPPEMAFSIQLSRKIAQIDNVSLTAGDRILIKNSPSASGEGLTYSTSESGNGVYVVTGATTTLSVDRSTDADSTAEFTPEMYVFVQDGSLSEVTYQIGYTGSTVSVDTTPLEFSVVDISQNNAESYVSAEYVPSYVISKISDLYPYWTGSFNDYNTGKWEYRDYTWDTMPPSIYDPQFNVNASYLKPLADEPDLSFPVGAPALIETIFELQWLECDFSWDQSSTLGSFLASYQATGSTVTVTDYYSITIQQRGFANGDDVTISNSTFSGTYNISNVSGNSFDINVGSAPEFSTGTLTYSTDIAQISTTFNRLSWDTIAQGEYLDMRVQVEMYAEKTFTYDSGRKPISEFTTPYYDSTLGLTYSRILDAVVLPYEGVYDVSVYIFDITNNFTMQYKTYRAVTPTAEITASYQTQEIYDDWDNLLGKVWSDISFDWYYPAECNSLWENADLSWSSLEIYSYKNQQLREDKTLVDILEIDRTVQSVIIQGDYTNAEYSKAGDFLYFERKSNKLEFENYEIAIGDLGLTGNGSDYSSSVSSIDLSTLGSTCSIIISGTVSPYLVGDQIIVAYDSSNYFTGSIADIQSSSLLLNVNKIVGNSSYSQWDINLYGEYIYLKNYTASLVQPYSKLLIKLSQTPFYELTVSDFFYADAIEISGSFVRLKSSAFYVDKFYEISTSQPLYMDGGIYAGTYAIEIVSSKAKGSNTVFYLNDPMKELYKLDGYFQPYLTSYDVDYAETHIGLAANNQSDMEDVDWNNLQEKSWITEERHSAANAGFLITSVAPDGKIKIDDYPSFFFSGDGSLNYTELDSLLVAAEELNASENEGISQFEYSVYPMLASLKINDVLGEILYAQNYVGIGATSIDLQGITGSTAAASPFSLKVPPKLEISLTGDEVSSISVLQSGSGYDSSPVIYIAASSTGVTATATVNIDSQGKVISVDVVNSGSGYTSVPSYVVNSPNGAEEFLTDSIWTGSEWKRVSGVDANRVFLSTSIGSPVYGNYPLAIPYKFHKQMILESPKKMKDFYFFILASSKTPGLKSLQGVEFDNGVEGEWYKDPQKSHSYPLKNTFLFSIEGKDLSRDAQYQYWEKNGKDFPVEGYNFDDSRALYAGAFAEPFAYAEAVITPYSFAIERSTTVVFHDDSTRLPQKSERIWKIEDAETGKMEVESLSKKLMWNFSKNGKYTVSLEVKDKTGNVSRVVKKSFVIVK
jgi:hypothetical protein